MINRAFVVIIVLVALFSSAVLFGWRVTGVMFGLAFLFFILSVMLDIDYQLRKLNEPRGLRLRYSIALASVPTLRGDLTWPRLGEMCDVIAESEILVKPDGEPPSSEEVLCYSPTGEVLMLYTWYPIAAVVTARVRSEK